MQIGRNGGASGELQIKGNIHSQISHTDRAQIISVIISVKDQWVFTPLFTGAKRPMCLAIPGKVKKIKGNKAFFNYEGEEYSSDISLAPEVKVGDWILMHDGRALSKISDSEAKENLKFIKTHKEMHDHEH